MGTALIGVHTGDARPHYQPCPRQFQFVHAGLFLLALARLLYVTRRLKCWWIAWAMILLVLTDVGYVAYLNSLYYEPAACISFLFLLAEAIDMSCSEEPRTGQLIRWGVFAVFLVSSKVQYVPFCAPLAVYTLSLAKRGADKSLWLASFGGMIGVCLAAAFMYRSVLPAPRVASVYNAVFSGILPGVEITGVRPASVGPRSENTRNIPAPWPGARTPAWLTAFSSTRFRTISGLPG